MFHWGNCVNHINDVENVVPELPPFIPALHLTENTFIFLLSKLLNSQSPCYPPLSTGGVIAYISSGSASSPESCMSDSSSSSYLSCSLTMSRPLLPSRAVGMLVDIGPMTKAGQHRGPVGERSRRSSSSSSSSKRSITSKPTPPANRSSTTILGNGQMLE